MILNVTSQRRASRKFGSRVIMAAASQGLAADQFSGGSPSSARSESGAPLRRPQGADGGVALERSRRCKHPSVRPSVWNGAALSTEKL